MKTGLHTGARPGLYRGFNDDGGSGGAGVIDPFPTTEVGLNSALDIDIMGSWSSIYPCQDSSSHLVDALGNANFTRGGSGSITYLQDGPTDSQKSVKSNTEVGSGGATIFSRTGPFVAASPVAWLAAFRIHTWSASRTLGTLGINPADDSKLVLPYTDVTSGKLTMRTYRATATLDPSPALFVTSANHTSGWFPFLFVSTSSGVKFATSGGVTSETAGGFKSASWTTATQLGLFSGGWGTSLISSCAYYAISVDSMTCNALYADPAAALTHWQGLWV